MQKKYDLCEAARTDITSSCLKLEAELMIQTEKAEMMLKYEAQATDTSYQLNSVREELSAVREEYKNTSTSLQQKLSDMTHKYEAEAKAHGEQGRIALAHDNTIKDLKKQLSTLTMSTSEITASVRQELNDVEEKLRVETMGHLLVQSEKLDLETKVRDFETTEKSLRDALVRAETEVQEQKSLSEVRSAALEKAEHKLKLCTEDMNIIQEQKQLF